MGDTCASSVPIPVPADGAACGGEGGTPEDVTVVAAQRFPGPVIPLECIDNDWQVVAAVRPTTSIRREASESGRCLEA